MHPDILRCNSVGKGGLLSRHHDVEISPLQFLLFALFDLPNRTQVAVLAIRPMSAAVRR
eukprot:CAMPEP_0183587068 /NCGR_PEP_ID=MMETSP0371-20130417/158315_1 /TAXON_ID=268820 /ORGANISM="Peridinium aciculiferum, Strain PAER-2" /LENGTH=58 /DNA_ID=CAMNT_0025798219 /DNA_START=90 /DNA_END=262 /DNA_ORIENTATION=+